MKRILHALAPVALTIIPAIASAQLGGIGGLIGQANMLRGPLLGLLASIALLVFFWGLVKFIFAAGSEEAKDQGKRIMIWGVVALFVMVSVWGLVAFLQQAFLGQTNFNPPPLPTFGQ